jgi:hypothetical protein
MDQLLKVIENEKNNRFKNSWIKLDKGSKLNRLKIYIEKQQIENDLTDKEGDKLKKILFNLCENDSLNKTIDIDYDIESCEIKNIKNLKYNKDKNLYEYDLPKKIIKSPSKSKSNIDRHFSKSKTK